MAGEFDGTKEEIEAKATRIVQAIIPEAKCEVWDYEHKIRCGMVDASGKKHEFVLLLSSLDRDILETSARGLKNSMTRATS